MIWTDLTPEQKQDAVREAVTVRHLSYGEAARELGTTRNSIAGVVNRSYAYPDPIPRMSTERKLLVRQESAKMAREGQPPAKPKAPTRPKKRRKPAARLGSFLRLPSEIPIAGDIEGISKSGIWSPLPGTAPVPVKDHHEGRCRWPTGADLPFHYCNEAVAGEKVYCAAHAAIAYREPPPRKDNGRRDSR